MGEHRPLILTLTGEWDIYRRDELEALLRPALEKEHVILDLSAVSYADSTVLSALAMLRKGRLGLGLAPSAIVASPSVRRLLTITRMDRLWPCFETVEAAMASRCAHEGLSAG